MNCVYTNHLLIDYKNHQCYNIINNQRMTTTKRRDIITKQGYNLVSLMVSFHDVDSHLFIVW